MARDARDGRGATTAAEHRTCAPHCPQRRIAQPGVRYRQIGLMALQNDDGRGSVLGVARQVRAERSPSAKSGFPKVGSMTTPIAEYGRALTVCAPRRSLPVQLAARRPVGRVVGVVLCSSMTFTPGSVRLARE